jgi:hypothetical protein
MADAASLHQLSSFLRSPEKWPAGFVWDYTSPNSCAEALSKRLTNRRAGMRIDDRLRAKAFLFADRNHPSKPKFSEVSADQVADLIDMHQ